jgi:hypothetical protein
MVDNHGGLLTLWKGWETRVAANQEEKKASNSCKKMEAKPDHYDRQPRSNGGHSREHGGQQQMVSN